MAEPMPKQIREKLFKLRCRSKRGDNITPDEFAWLQVCYTQWPDEYKSLDEPVSKEARPFGARPADNGS